jgi:outer membrane protein OmpA-like peptidoglycan-associated protein
MSKCFFTITVLFLFAQCFGQSKNNPYEFCEGSVNVFKSGEYKLAFRGEKKVSTVFDQYPSMDGISSANQIWISFVAMESGQISFSVKAKQSSIKFVIFSPTMKDVCSELKDGMAEIKRFAITNKLQTAGLSENVTENFLYPMNLTVGELVYIVLIGDSEVNELIDFSFNFQPEVEDVEAESKLLDFRYDDFSPYLKITIRDALSGHSIVANTSLDGGKELNGLYKASDLMFSISRNTKLNFKCELEGYFFLDSTDIRILSTKSQELVINLIPVTSGKKLKLEDIDFIAGTSDISPISELRLGRLRDFLALNSTVKIEIGGHVFEPGNKNSNAGQKMSEARAKRVLKYLVENGIDKDRLTSVGYGNTQPIYIKPLHTYEEQANRRVEIIVK